ncbi:DUF1684 domain-containing protein [Flavobacterium terrae]|uniref:DUF1684 domain-containing protein n=1 Tax=Flavobacterium terrae TaxID=415425 RepID=A0A1M6HCH7_9FLAO|nr:DUF1684 domain-containing protein [Flavobacterium terrae]SHJ19843.1 hypothetical protein SAMN05444363_2966 [Flavobacterium terrae]
MKKYSYLLFFIFSISLNAQKKLETSLEYQQNLNKEFADSTSSPLAAEDLKVFKALDFYPIDEKYIVEAKFIRAKREKVFEMKTTTTRLPKYKKYGELHFILEGKSFKLNVYQNLDLIKKPGFKDYLFLPFTDLTCGKESYIGGRYLDARIPKKDVMIIDFNKAYNPYCAYNHKYSCPLVPLENDLDIEIKAGVKKFHD